MFRGGDYIDNPRFSNPNQIKNTMDVSVSIINEHINELYYDVATILTLA